ncbi:MAG: 3-phosphoshikimate 1-carboxyvinyltransferase [Clostridia bacterium]|nr:3-phosphoshikimate 1-carboxyvinyltransferase [Clostridia bacterium]
MKARIAPFQARGEVRAQTSKSFAHRLLICAALADGESIVRMENRNDDIDATLRCLSSFTKVEVFTDGARVDPAERKGRSALPVLDCGECGSTLRFLLPMASAHGGASFTGRGRLPQRPLDDLLKAMENAGASFTASALPFSVDGGYSGGECSLPGNVSSQYLTALLLAAPAVPKDTVIRLTTPLESAAYVVMTLQAMAAFGVQAECEDGVYHVPGGRRYRAQCEIAAEGDFSSAAFPLCLGALSGPVTVRGLSRESLQGDKAITEILQAIGAKVSWQGDSVTVQRDQLRAFDVDVSAIPDMTPSLAAVLMHARGQSRLYNAARLRLKESDRLVTVRDMVLSLGGRARIEDDALVIDGVSSAGGGQVDGAGDHRIVMAAAVAASACQRDSVILDAQALNKSYPAFPSHLQMLGGSFNVIDDR